MTQRYGGPRGRYPDEARFEDERLDEQGERIRYGEHGSMRLGSAYRGAQDARGFYEGGSRSGAPSGFDQHAGYFGVGGLGERDRGIRAGDRAAHDAWSRSAPRGPHWGKSPRGYRRSDERIREDVCDRLMHGHVDPSGVTVRVQDGDVTLEGHVTSREEKRLVEEIAEEVLGVKDVENRLKVGARAEPAASDRTQGKGASRAPNATERH